MKNMLVSPEHFPLARGELAHPEHTGIQGELVYGQGWRFSALAEIDCVKSSVPRLGYYRHVGDPLIENSLS